MRVPDRARLPPEAGVLTRRPDDPLDLIKRVILTVDRQNRGGSREVNGIDDGFDLGGYAD
jgi:hypothetical protein